MRDTFKKGMTLGLGLAALSKEQAEKVIDELMTKGELSREESDGIFQEWERKGEESRNAIDEIIKDKINKLLEELEVVTKRDLRALEQRMTQLENQLKEKE
ncbi:phasin family protein [Gracilibacillus kekensis]|uniref:Polyhydroxyalkanoate synthesis regulator phasin n=1 Tax=Gracilibacillus kekensis TaxID=1027249 RepID=A0A1M7L6V4_9BACI|nr:phasin family protein [Gracilibacillus kekensis]SHM73084.1 Polyhydroxyalkanoate synthesis regulator phasin [Gracilibacillus kekensis]